METLLTSLVSSSTRARLLLRLFSNPQLTGYLRELASEFDVSTNAVRGELNRLEKAKIITSQKRGREVHYQANAAHPLFDELVSIAKKILGIDLVVEHIVNQVGDLKLALLVGDYAAGRDTQVVDLVLVGKIDQMRLNEMVARTEELIGRKIRTLCLTSAEYDNLSKTLLKDPYVVLWQE